MNKEEPPKNTHPSKVRTTFAAEAHPPRHRRHAASAAAVATPHHRHPSRMPDLLKISAESSPEGAAEADTTNGYSPLPVRSLQWQDSLWNVLTRSYGSVWPRVLPYCLANALLAALLLYVLPSTDKFTISPSGHKYTSLLMSFLIITRVKICYDNYMAAAQDLFHIYENCRDLVVHACLLTSTDRSRYAQEWRHRVAKGTLSLLRATMAVLELVSHPELQTSLVTPKKHHKARTDSEGDTHMPMTFWKEDMNDPSSSSSSSSSSSPLKQQQQRRRPTLTLHDSQRRLAHVTQDDQQQQQRRRPTWTLRESRLLAHVAQEDRHVLEEARRVPYQLAYNLRRYILQPRCLKQKDNKQPQFFNRHPCNEELNLLAFCDDILSSYSELIKTITTPLPFPLVQMTKTFLFVWIFTLPLALCHGFDYDHEKYSGILVLVMVFLITFGFFGLEVVAMELSDCFGDDPVDFDDAGYMQLCMEDCYIAVYQVDGVDWALKLRQKQVQEL